MFQVCLIIWASLSIFAIATVSRNPKHVVIELEADMPFAEAVKSPRCFHLWSLFYFGIF